MGDGGLVLHHNGNDWELMDSGTSMDLHDVFKVPGGAAYAVGEDETVLRYEDGQWTVLHEAPGTTDFLAVWGFEGKCTPERRFGFKIDSLTAELEERETPDEDMAWADEAVLAWLGDLADLWAMGALWECVPPMPCWDELQGKLDDLVGAPIAAGTYLDTGQVLDLTHQALAETFGEQAVSPALTAYALVQSAMAVHPQSLIESGLAEKAVLWSLREQGLRSPARSKGVLSRVVKIDFAKPRVGVRDTLRNADGTVLPGVHPPDLTGYPGFREATDEELADEQGAHAYLRERRMSILQYRLVRELEVAQDNTESLLSILGTDASTEPEVREKVQKLTKAAKWSLEAQERLRQHVVDTDGDGLVDADDLCPGECARGMDVDGDGCIDRGCGLVEELCGVAMWFPARMVLWMKARRACWFEQRGRWRAAAGQLRAFERIARAYARMGWVDEKGAEYLRAYAINARDAALGRLDRLDCP
ncbi:MAG: hypothetical protein JXR96_20520 [Deltaproteobacteria bacterium]|nr:hypothetical protein [Deltaproteobacteria bacterium]